MQPDINADINTDTDINKTAEIFNYDPDAFGEQTRVRFAPSPTGKLHIGGVRTAIYNWAFARATKGVFILRIDDTDPTRSTQENTDSILEALHWLGIDWDEGPELGGNFGPYFQTERLAMYTAALEKMKAQDKVYPCFCTAEELKIKREAMQKTEGYSGYDRSCRCIDKDEAAKRIAAGQAHVWRIKVPLDRGDIEFYDEVYGHCHFNSDVIDDFVIMRSDGSPTYNFSTAVDDALMGITHVIRGDDHLSNTPRQIMVYEALGVPIPSFAHLSMILGSDGKRLSKRHGATSIQDFRDAGYTPEAMLNYLALLGWSLDGETTVFDKQTLFENFSLDRINRSSAVFDKTKLQWLNSVYIKEMGASEFIDRALPFLEAAKLSSDPSKSTREDVEARRSWYEAIYPLVAERIKVFTELPDMICFLFSGNELEFEQKSVDKILAKEGALEILEAVESALSDENMEWEEESIEAALRTIPEQMELKPKKVFQVARVAITGKQVSPPLFASIALLSRENCLARIQQAKKLAVVPEAPAE